MAGRFSGGINLLFRDPAAFVPVQTRAVPLHPFAVEVDGPPPAAPIGIPVDVDVQGLRIGPVLVDLRIARPEPLGLGPLRDEEVGTVHGRAPRLSAFLQRRRDHGTREPFGTQIAAVADSWQRSGDPGDLLELVGLGGGSTPSGDDLLVGLLAGLTLFERVSPRARETLTALRPRLQATVRDRTALPPAQMIEAILLRQAPEPLCGLIAALRDPTGSEAALDRAIARVASLGASSGLFLLSGLLRAWEASCTSSAPGGLQAREWSASIP